MNTESSYIKSVCRRYYGAFGENQEINPISQIDISIINELLKTIEKFNNTELLSIMNNYKLEKDRDILEKLIDTNKSLRIGEFDETQELPYWVHFNDIKRTRLLRVHILYFHIEDAIGRDFEQYGIVLNQVSDDMKQIPMHSNLLLLYNDRELRDRDVQQLDDLIKY